ncbi:cytochrome P450 CYP749A22-like [Argentina anserina]|uniref:cytochrome P450 CYP749A22-like n=1 Tax=Argentina anserina TaxID=57926 RepID=UPI0021769573|nr:cytochrome P450 CYP749A22-like [Potentilla anserina]
MGDQGVIILPSLLVCLFMILLIFIINILRKQWWNPIRLQNLMGFQGIKGPSYRLIHGNNKEISNMKRKRGSSTVDQSPYTTLGSHDTFSQVHPHIQSWTKTYGKNYLQWNGRQAQLVITEPELCREILENKDGSFTKLMPPSYIKKLKGVGIPRSVGAKWVKLRKLGNHAYHGESLKSMIPAMIASTETLLERWGNHDGKEIDVFEEFKLLTSEVISRTIFGSSYLEGLSIFEKSIKLMFSFIFKSPFKLRLPGISKIIKTSDEVGSEKLEKEIRDNILSIVQKREKAMRAGGEGNNFGSDLLGYLLRTCHDSNDNNRILLEELVDECKILYFAGQETLDVLTWTVFLLALHTDWQEEARKEVLEVFGKQAPNPNDIFKLKTMSMIINESLRLYPPLVSLVRKVEKEVRLGNLIIPADVQLLIPTLAFHHEQQFWGPDVHLFKPERFSEGIAKATSNNRAAFLPFGMGPRTCVGFNFATTEAKIVLSMILQRHTITISPTYVHSPREFITVQPENGVQVVLHSL